MDTATLGMLFAVLGFAATFLMYKLWGYPFDKATKTSAAPKWAMITHRVLGYLFAICYVVMMWKMVPRLWEYQVELKTATVVHVVVGITLGFLLMIKISIMRFFRHFEEWMPYLGTGILFCTVLLLSLSLPAVLVEKARAARAFTPENLARVQRLLPKAGFPAEAPLEELATVRELQRGRHVLRYKCVVCHDLQTVIRKPRTPAGWAKTVLRMGDKPALFDPISERELWQATSYLIAITPVIQKSERRRRRDRKKLEGSAKAAKKASAADMSARQFDLAESKSLFEEECSQCHETSDVDDSPPQSREEVDELVGEMVEEGLELEAAQIEQIKWYLVQTYVKGDAQPKDEGAMEPPTKGSGEDTSEARTDPPVKGEQP